jgi:hypothetical protein
MHNELAQDTGLIGGQVECTRFEHGNIRCVMPLNSRTNFRHFLRNEKDGVDRLEDRSSLLRCQVEGDEGCRTGRCSRLIRTSENAVIAGSYIRKSDLLAEPDHSDWVISHNLDEEALSMSPPSASCPQEVLWPFAQERCIAFELLYRCSSLDLAGTRPFVRSGEWHRNLRLSPHQDTSILVLSRISANRPKRS